ncbi:hypothetical protein AB0H36_05230 [Kribbella sp. NPDC050820]|uniref:hypothetical protein n=1 Tax=Kribbella sp. NPDC050820 TaxID=3155408 RepID=UPI0033DE2361
MARRELDISHDTFRALPCDRTHNYLRELLASLGVLPAYEPRIERIPPWLDHKLAPLPADHADLVRRFAHRHVLRRLRTMARQGQLTKTATDSARDRISAAIRFLTYLHAHDTTAATATQEQLERYQTSHAISLASEYTFITWLRRSRTNTRLRIPYLPAAAPTVSISDEQRWQHVERLLHDHTLRSYTRLGGLFTLLFAQPLSRIVAMRTSQITTATDNHADSRVDVTFNTLPIQMPTPVDQIIETTYSSEAKASTPPAAANGSSPAANQDNTSRPRTSAPNSLPSASSPTSHAKPHFSSSPARCPPQSWPNSSASPTPPPPTGPNSPPATGPATSPTAGRP